MSQRNGTTAPRRPIGCLPGATDSGRIRLYYCATLECPTRVASRHTGRSMVALHSGQWLRPMAATAGFGKGLPPIAHRAYARAWGVGLFFALWRMRAEEDRC